MQPLWPHTCRERDGWVCVCVWEREGGGEWKRQCLCSVAKWNLVFVVVLKKANLCTLFFSFIDFCYLICHYACSSLSLHLPRSEGLPASSFLPLMLTSIYSGAEAEDSTSTCPWNIIGYGLHWPSANCAVHTVRHLEILPSFLSLLCCHTVVLDDRGDLLGEEVKP